MTKKGKGDKPTSARGHREESVIRFREKKELIRVDRYGNPLNRSIPFNVMSNNWLASHKHNAPPTDHTKNPPPDNVASITSGKPKVSKPVSQSGNEAEKIPHRNHRLRAPHERSIEGHNKLKFEKPPSTVHNPLLTEPESGGYSTSKPLDRKFWDMSSKRVPMAPSGIPISEFVTGKFKPKENAVVYTTDTPPWEEQPKYTPPPTPTRDWRASNDHHYHAAPVEKTATEWARQTKATVQWFINHVEPQNWPTHVHNFARWVDDGPIVNTGAINKAASHPETELILMRSLNEGLKKDWHMLDQALLDSQSENNLLRQELQATRNEVKLLEFELAHHTGDTESLEEIRREMDIVEPKTPRIPDDVDSMLREFRIYQSFERVYGPEHAFARFVYDKPDLGKTMREHADARCKERESAMRHRNVVRFLRQLGSHILNEAQTKYEQEKYDNYVNFWKDKYPLYLKQRARRTVGAVRNPARESVSLAAMARKAKPAQHNSSTYYSTLDGRSQYLTSLVAKRIIHSIKPTRTCFNNPNLVEGDDRTSWCRPKFRGMLTYEQWWAERLDYCEVHYQEVKHPLRVGVVRTYNKVVDTLNKPVDPITIRRQKKVLARLKAEQHERDERREQRKEERAECKKRKAEKDHIRKMQRIAH